MARNFDPTSRFSREEFKLRRLHWLTWLTFVASSIVVVLLVIPGHGVEPTLLTPQPFMWGRIAGSGPMPDPDLAIGPLFVEEYEHGWPFTFLRRAVGAGGKGWPKGINNDVVIGWPDGGSVAPWDHRLAWAFSGDVSQWNSAAFAADLIIALALIVAPACACQWWIVRRGGRLRIRIADLLVAAVLVAAALAWHQSHVQLQAVEERLLVTLPAPGALLKSSWRDYRWEYRGPLWFDRLLGLANYRCFRHLNQVTVIVDEMTDEDWRLLSQAAYVSDVRLHGAVSAEAAGALALLGHLRVLELCGGVGETDLFSNPAPELQRLDGLKSLESICCYRRNLLIEDMDAIVAIPTLEEICVNGILATIDEQHAFRDAHPRLKVTCDEASESKFQNPGTDSWEVAHARLVRWRNEDSVQIAEPADHAQNLDLRGIRLEHERMLKLRPVLATVKELRFDKSASVSAVIALLRQSPNVTRIRAAGLAANCELLACMAEMPRLAEVDVSQGSAGADDFLQLQRTKEFYWLNLYETTLSESELSDLLDELNRRGDAEAYRGLDDETPAIAPVDDPDGPFGAGF